MEEKRVKSIAVFQIFLLLGAGISYSYLVSETNDIFQGYNSESLFIKIARALALEWLGGNLVSAQGMYTCIETLPGVENGGYCQEYYHEECDSLCTESCFPGSRSDFALCELGTCFDSTEGTCSFRSPRYACEEAGGQWSVDIPAYCNLGCCQYNDDARYVNEITCNRISDTLGVETEFSQVGNELECLALANQNTKGACVIEVLFENQCSFITRNDCISQGGSFFENTLCTHPDLNTVCEITQETACVENKDGIYLKDSCGNIANIYDAQRINDIDYWKRPISPENSCGTGSTDGNSGSQTCGNCNRFLSSVCSEKTLSGTQPAYGDFICRSLSCGVVDGEDRSSGESWCVYDSQIGVEGDESSNGERSVDVPGSRHYRKTCIDGEVVTDPCQDYRNEVCVQDKPEDNEDFTSAACVLNEWQACVQINFEEDMIDKCENNEVCYIKSTAIDEGFAFDVCAPKYPPGFNLREGDGGDAQQLCSLASQDCTIIYVKKADGSWDCEGNCECRNKVFGESMNNLCMSLGDCGGHYNLEGSFSDEGYNIGGSTPQLSDDYKSGLRSLITPRFGQSAEAFNVERTLSLFGVANNEGSASYSGGTSESSLDAVSGVSGAAGIAIYSLAGTQFGAAAGIGTQFAGPPLLGQTMPVVMNGAGGALVGALLGAAAVAYLLSATGVGNGLDPALAYSLIALGAAGGFILGGYAYAQGVSSIFTLAGWPVVGWIILLIVILIIVILAVAGVGDDRKEYATFECLPWQPPRGGSDCELCGDNGLPCSRYKCESLGQTCRFINEGTEDEACIDSSPNDVAAPVISPWDEALSEGYSYDLGGNGVSIVRDDSDGCINAFTPVVFGIELDEPASCKWSLEEFDSYDEMPSNFYGGSNLLKEQHSHIALMPSLDSLGIPEEFLPELEDELGTYRLNTRCSDANGNSNVAPYIVEFCVSDSPDNTAAAISNFEPESGGYVSFSAEEYDITFNVNEPAECRWDFSDVDYETMSNIVDCDTETNEGTVLGWECRATLPTDVLDSSFTYYFRCKDQPWLEGSEDDENTRNTNSESQIYNLQRSPSELFITSVSPDNETIYSANQPVPLDLVITTAGGVDGGAICHYSINGQQFSQFWPLPVDSTIHEQALTGGLFAGDHIIDYMCEDIANNVVEASSSFTIAVDDEGPLITRAYDLNGELTVITNEDSQCAISTEDCNFDFADATLMSGQELSHSIEFETSLTNYVKCRDVFENTGSCLTVTGGF